MGHKERVEERRNRPDLEPEETQEEMRLLHAMAEHKNPIFSEIVIVGAGISGLATALSFHRLGMQTLVLEKSDKLRAGGTSISLWKNAWHALDVLGVSDELRKNYVNITCAEILSEAEKLIQQVRFSNNSSHELRAVERTALVEALAKPLPEGTIRFNSKVAKILKTKGGPRINIYLDDETTISSKVIIGCDGVHSVVAKWMGLKEPSFVGQYVIRGVAKYMEGHKFGTVGRQYLGRGVRTGIAPISLDKVYWFLAFNNHKQGWMTDVERMKEEAKLLIQNWSSKSKEVMRDLIDNTPLETLSTSTLRYRWSLPFFAPKLATNGVALAGDALHPMTHGLAQGGCLALEDGVILARGIYNALKAQEDSSQQLTHALQTYMYQRWKRFLPLTILSHIMGAVMTLSSPFGCYLRDTFALRLLLRASVYSRHTHFHCGTLPIL